MPTEHIKYTDSLRQGTDKLNAAIDLFDDSLTVFNQALDTANDASNTANQAAANANTATTSADNAAQRANDAADVIDGWGQAVAFQNGTTYDKNNVVTYNGSTYQAKLDGVTSTPPTAADWILLAQRGLDGSGAVASVEGNLPDPNGDVKLPTMATKQDMQVIADDLTTQKAESVQEFELRGVNISKFGVVGDGVADDTQALQDAIDYCTVNKLKLYCGNANAIFNITSPIYLDGDIQIDLSGASVVKANNSLGVGSNLQRSGTYTTAYAVDASFIVRHKDNDFSSNIKITNIAFYSTISQKNNYAIYAPFMKYAELENLTFANCDYGIYGYCWYLIPSIKNLKGDALKSIIALVNDGTDLGSSTSLQFSQIYGTNCVNVIKLYGVAYSVMNIPCGDFCSSHMLELVSCKEITINSPSTEHAQNGNFAHINNSSVVINSPNAFRPDAPVVESHMLNIEWYSRVIINNGTFENFNGSDLSNMFKMLIKDGSHVILNNIQLPTNGNAYMGLTNKSSVSINDGKGRVFIQGNGDYVTSDIVNGKSVVYGYASPTNGDWKLGDMFYNLDPKAGGYVGWICITAGTPGTWKGFGLIEGW